MERIKAMWRLNTNSIIVAFGANNKYNDTIVHDTSPVISLN